MKKFNSRRRLRSAVVDAFANKLHYYQLNVDLFNHCDSVGAIGQVLDSLDEIDMFRYSTHTFFYHLVNDSFTLYST